MPCPARGYEVIPSTQARDSQASPKGHAAETMASPGSLPQSQHEQVQGATADVSQQPRKPAAISRQASSSCGLSPPCESSWLLKGDLSEGCWAEVVLKGGAVATVKERVLDKRVGGSANAVAGGVQGEEAVEANEERLATVAALEGADFASEMTGGEAAKAAEGGRDAHRDEVGEDLADESQEWCAFARQGSTEGLGTTSKRWSATGDNQTNARHNLAPLTSSSFTGPATPCKRLVKPQVCHCHGPAATAADSNCETQTCERARQDSSCSSIGKNAEGSRTPGSCDSRVTSHVPGTATAPPCTSTTTTTASNSCGGGNDSTSVVEAAALADKSDYGSGISWGPSSAASWQEWWAQMRQPQEVKRCLKVLGYGSAAGSLSGIMAGMTGEGPP
jgi:hypothetical protein